MNDHVTPACGATTNYDNILLMRKVIVKLTPIRNAKIKARNAKIKARRLNRRKPEAPNDKKSA